MNSLAKLAIGSALLLMACHGKNTPSATAIGSRDRDGNLIIHVFSSVGEPSIPLPVALGDDYGFMIFNEGTMEAPSMRIIIASKADGKITEAHDWDEVIPLLEKIPPNSRIYRYSRCSVPTHYGLPQDALEEFADLLEKRHLVYKDEETRVTCTCIQAEK